MRDLVIITGASGRIGTALAERLEKKYFVIGFELLKAIPPGKEEELMAVDITSEESVHQAFMHIRKYHSTRIASVIHLAAYYSFEKKNSKLYDKITVKGTERLLKYLQKLDVEQFIFTSTELIHKPTKPGKPITEESPIEGDWGYPRSKIITEKLIHEQRGKIPVVTMRVAGVYDDHCHSIPISNQIQRIYEKKLEAHFYPANKTHGASFVHMEDLVDAIALAVDKRNELPPETTLLIGEPETLSYDFLQNEISRLLFNVPFKTYRIPKLLAKVGAELECLIHRKHKPFIRPWMIDFANDHYELDISKAKKVLGWEPHHSLRETLPVMIEELKKDPQKWYKLNQLQK